MDVQINPNILKIATNLELNITNMASEEATDVCFSAICSLLSEKKWEKIFPLKTELCQLVNSVGQTVIGFCIASSDETALEVLIDHEIAVVLPDPKGNFPIQLAAENGLLSVVKKLAECNDFFKKNALGQTALHLAAYRGHAPVVTYLLDNQVPQSLAKWEHGVSSLELSPLALAIMAGHIECVDLFLVRIPSTEWNRKYKGIGNLLHVALFFQQNHILERLLTLYLDQVRHQMEELNENGQTPLMLAAYIGNEKALRILIAKQAKVDAVNDNGNTALHWAVLGEQKNSVTLLVFHKAQFKRNHDRKDPIQLARENSALEGYLRNIERAGVVPGTINLERRKPRVLVYKGGGVKGLAHAGLNRALERYGMMESVTHIGGTSAGAMIGALVAVNYNSTRIIQIFKEINFMDLFDYRGKDLGSAIRNPKLGHIYTVLTTMAKAIKSPLTTTVSIISNSIQALWHTKGICHGEVVRQLMEKLISDETTIPYMTFGELRKGIEEGKGYRHLHLFATKIGPNPEILDINSEDPRWDHYIISDAIRGSISIPGVFDPHHLHIKNAEGQRVLSPETFVVVDGGVLCNLGIEAFDRKCYSTTDYTEQDKNFPVFNTRTLGLSLYDPKDQIPKLNKEPENIGQFLYDIVSIYFGAEDLIRNRNPYNKTRIVEVSTCGIGTLDFKLSDTDKEDLIASGVAGLEAFLKQQDPQFEVEEPADPMILCPNEEADMVFTQTKNQVPGSSGVHLIAICVNNACRKVQQEQWLYCKPKSQTVDIAKFQTELRCPGCNDRLENVVKIVLSNCKSTMVYGDSKGKHTKEIETTRGTAEVIQWTQTIRYIKFTGIQSLS